jgi:hypothetical protein
VTADTATMAIVSFAASFIGPPPLRTKYRIRK